MFRGAVRLRARNPVRQSAVAATPAAAFLANRVGRVNRTSRPITVAPVL
jgi:hypothetical protein